MTAPSLKEFSQSAQNFFKRARELSDKDNGKLWGSPLYGPMLIQSPSLNTLIANRNDPQGILKRKGNIYIGKIPPSIPAASFAENWAGISWAIYKWPLPHSLFERECYMMHELMHSRQMKMWEHRVVQCAHLFNLNSRIWLRLEWLALKSALLDTSDDIKGFIQDALVFRKARHQQAGGLDEAEASLDLYEGLAEYTGFKLSSVSEKDKLVILGKRIDGATGILSLVRYFPYISGPAYGLLFDMKDIGWRNSINANSDLGKIAEDIFSIELPANLEKTKERLMSRYNGDEVVAEETFREQKLQDMISYLYQTLIDGPTLSFLFLNTNFSFDPKTEIPLPGCGTVFLSFQTKGDWGELTATKGVLLPPEKDRLILPAPLGEAEHSVLKGDGWTINLRPNWHLEEDASSKHYRLKKQK